MYACIHVYMYAAALVVLCASCDQTVREIAGVADPHIFRLTRCRGRGGQGRNQSSESGAVPRPRGPRLSESGVLPRPRGP